MQQHARIEQHSRASLKPKPTSRSIPENMVISYSMSNESPEGASAIGALVWTDMKTEL